MLSVIYFKRGEESSLRTVSFPIPPEAPVIKTVRPCNLLALNIVVIVALSNLGSRSQLFEKRGVWKFDRSLSASTVAIPVFPVHLYFPLLATSTQHINVNSYSCFHLVSSSLNFPSLSMTFPWHHFFINRKQPAQSVVATGTFDDVCPWDSPFQFINCWPRDKPTHASSQNIVEIVSSPTCPSISFSDCFTNSRQSRTLPLTKDAEGHWSAKHELPIGKTLYKVIYSRLAILNAIPSSPSVNFFLSCWQQHQLNVVCRWWYLVA